MTENPYQASAAAPEPGRRSPWVGNAVIVLAVAIYGPTTVTPLVRACLGREIPLMLGAFAFNGTVFALLIALGRWLRRQALHRDSRLDPES